MPRHAFTRYLSVALLLTALCVLLFASASGAQDGDPAQDPPPVVESDEGAESQNEGEAGGAEDAEAPQEEETAPETFDPLLEEFRTLYREIRDEGGRPLVRSFELRDLREKVGRFNALRMPTELSLAVELQILEWLNQYGAARNELFERMEGASIAHPGLRLKWARHLLESRFQYERVLEVLDGVEFDLETHPSAAVVRASCLVALDQYEDAEATLAAIPTTARRTPQMLDEIALLRERIEPQQALWSEERARLDAEAQADDLPRVEFTTLRGAFTVELFENEAPNTVANFIRLVDEGFYNDLKFHQVSQNLFVITGDPTSAQTGVLDQSAPRGPGWRIRDEIPEVGARLHWTGYLSMVSAEGPHTAGSQFRIALRRLEFMDGSSTVFGRVIDGMRVVRNLGPDDQILKAAVLRKRDHEYAVEKIDIAAPIAPCDDEQDEDDVDEDEADGGGEAEGSGGDGGDGDGDGLM